MGKLFLLILLLLSSSQFNTSGQSNYYFHINRISLPIDNKGVIADVQVGSNVSGGLYDGNTFLYSGGFLLSGISNNLIWSNGVASSSVINDYQPGNVDSISTDPKYKIYTVNINEGNFPLSWTTWKDAVELGADFYDGNFDGIYNPIDLNSNGLWDPGEDKPDMIGDLTAWCVYNDGVPSNERRFNGVEPQGIEIHQTIFAYYIFSYGADLDNVIFIRYRIINTGKVTDTIDSVYFCDWADTDIGGALGFTDDLAAMDMDHNAGYIYNDGPDEQWGNDPPANFIKLIQGPVAYIPDETFLDNNSNGIFDPGIDIPLDSAYNFKGKFLGVEVFPGARNLAASSYIPYTQSDPVHGDPVSEFEARNYLMGLDKNGNLVDPCNWAFGEVMGGVDCTQLNPKFFYSGDPVTQTGWINNSPSDQRQLLNTGPFQLEVGKPVDIIVAHIVGRGSSSTSSITKARSISDYTRYFYNSNFGHIAVGINDKLTEGVSDFRLSQNYPNPFNPETKIKFSISESGIVSLRVYDILGNEVAILVNDEMSAGTYDIIFNAKTLSSGTYFYKLTTNGNVIVKKMTLVK